MVSPFILYNLPMNIILIGFMASGKSTIGKLLAEKMNYQFIDLDEIIEKHNGKKISDIFSQDGEEVFRKYETEQLKQLSNSDRKVVSCGGGIVIKPENRQILRKIGRVIFLEIAAQDVLARVTDFSSRPLLNNPDPQKRRQTIEDLLKKRDNFYRETADFILKSKTGQPEQDVQKILEYLTSNKK